MKKVQNTIALLAMFFIIIAALLTSFQVVIYGDSDYGFYEDLYRKYNVTDDLHMEMSDVMEVTDYMMAYLIGEEEELSIVTNVDGREQDFFNEQDRLHMADVKNLFLGGLRLRTALLVAAAVMIGILVLWKVDIRQTLSKAFKRAKIVFGAVAVLFCAGFLFDFTACFTMFHKIFFRNDLWLFDPATDYMIRMLPEGFFYSIAVRILLCFAVAVALMEIGFMIWRRVSEKGRNNY